VFILVATAGPIARGQNDAEALKEGKRLSGRWRVDVFEIDGNRITAKETKPGSSDVFESRWLFGLTKAEWVFDDGYKWEYATYKLNFRATPKTIDIVFGDSTLKGIYELQDKTLKACFSVRGEGRKLLPGKEGRPTDFTTKKDSERLLFFFERDDKPKAPAVKEKQEKAKKEPVQEIEITNEDYQKLPESFRRQFEKAFWESLKKSINDAYDQEMKKHDLTAMERNLMDMVMVASRSDLENCRAVSIVVIKPESDGKKPISFEWSNERGDFTLRYKSMEARTNLSTAIVTYVLAEKKTLRIVEEGHYFAEKEKKRMSLEKSK
jgi:uncharacterized protein (TIGR03067 family)